jgi:hypothetical protein
MTLFEINWYLSFFESAFQTSHCLLMKLLHLNPILTFHDSDAREVTKHFPFVHSTQYYNLSLVQYMELIAKRSQCRQLPIIVGMGQIKSNLYWLLIENFFHTLLRYDRLSCAVFICVLDELCCQKCQANNFPYYSYRNSSFQSMTNHIMEHVAEIKLYHVGQALERGVNIMLVDLDVGFLNDPMLLAKGFLDNPYEKIRCVSISCLRLLFDVNIIMISCDWLITLRAQQDLGHHTDKKTNTSFTSPTPNFGLFLIKSDPINIKLFQRAWRMYQKVPFTSRQRVAADQNVIIGSIKWVCEKYRDICCYRKSLMFVRMMRHPIQKEYILTTAIPRSTPLS